MAGSQEKQLPAMREEIEHRAAVSTFLYRTDYLNDLNKLQQTLQKLREDRGKNVIVEMTIDTGARLNAK